MGVCVRVWEWVCWEGGVLVWVCVGMGVGEGVGAGEGAGEGAGKKRNLVILLRSS